MDKTLPKSRTDTAGTERLNLEQALQTYPDWQHVDTRTAPLVLRPLDAGLTNSCYLIKIQDTPCVLRLNTRHSRVMGLDRVNEQVALKRAEQAGIGAPVVYCAPPQGVLVTQWLEGRHWSEDEAKSFENIDRLVALLKQVHALPPVGKHLIPLDVCGHYLRGIKAQFKTIPQRFQELEARMHRLMWATSKNYVQRCLCHNDPVLANLIDQESCLRLIDWEYAAMGDPYFDLAVIVHNFKFGDEQMLYLLQRYAGRCDNAVRRRFLHNYAIYVYIDMLWYWLQSAYTPGKGFGTIAESKLDVLVAILFELGVS